MDKPDSHNIYKLTSEADAKAAGLRESTGKEDLVELGSVI